MSTKREAYETALKVLEKWDQRHKAEMIRQYVAELHEALKASAELKEDALKAAARQAWEAAKKNLYVVVTEHCSETKTVQSSIPQSFDHWWSSREGGK